MCLHFHRFFQWIQIHSWNANKFNIYIIFHIYTNRANKRMKNADVIHSKRVAWIFVLKYKAGLSQCLNSTDDSNDGQFMSIQLKQRKPLPPTKMHCDKFVSPDFAFTFYLQKIFVCTMNCALVFMYSFARFVDSVVSLARKYKSLPDFEPVQ